LHIHGESVAGSLGGVQSVVTGMKPDLWAVMSK